MKKTAFLVSILLSVKLILAQGNLVPNPSFEFHTACPNTFGQVYKLVSWSNPTGGSPEYFDSCGTGGVGVPANWFGYEIPHDGHAYIGIAGGLGNYYEYVQTRLNDSLKAGVYYCIKYHVSLADRAALTTQFPQIYFSQDSINSTTPYYLNYTPQVSDTNMLYDTTGWMEVSGSFLANGGEKFMTIGSFIDSASTQFDTVNTNSNTEDLWYFYIDMIEVYEIVNAEAGSDVTICNGDSLQLGSLAKPGIVYSWNSSQPLNDSSSSQPWVRPNRTTKYYLTISDTGNLYCHGSLIDSVIIQVEDCKSFIVPTILVGSELFEITTLPANTALDIFDSRGRLVYTDSNYANDYSVVLMTAGIYYYQLRFPDQSVQRGKFCVIK